MHIYTFTIKTEHPLSPGGRDHALSLINNFNNRNLVEYEYKEVT